jgi:uncharacterized membrane protein YphA (DoxX/SURF4 family)
MALELSSGGEITFLVGRLLIGGLFAFMGLNHFVDAETMAGYAESKGVPAPLLSVLVSGGTLIFGGLLIALGLYPAIGAGALAAFFLVVTPKMHDFWNVDDPQQKQSEMTDFLKNIVLLGTSLVLLSLGSQAWPYAISL